MAFLQAVVIVVARESLSAFNRRGCRVPGTFRPLQSRTARGRAGRGSPCCSLFTILPSFRSSLGRSPLVLGLARLTGLPSTGVSPCPLRTGAHGCSPTVRLKTQKARPPERLGLGPGPLRAHSDSCLRPRAYLHAGGKVALVVFPGMRASDEVLTLTF